MRRLIVGWVVCVLLLASRASATYVVIENISNAAPNWGDCNCHQSTGWAGFITMTLHVADETGGYDLILRSSDKSVSRTAGNYYLVDVTKTNPIAPGARFVSKRIAALPESGFTLSGSGSNVGVYYCQACQDGCGGYSTGMTDTWPEPFLIVPGVGATSFDFQVPAAGAINGPSVIRVTFYPGNPPRRR